MDLSHSGYLHPTSLRGIMTTANATTREVVDTIVAG